MTEVQEMSDTKVESIGRVQVQKATEGFVIVMVMHQPSLSSYQGGLEVRFLHPDNVWRSKPHRYRPVGTE